MNCLKLLKKHGTAINYKRSEKWDYVLSVVAIVDTIEQNDHGKPSFVSGILLAKMELGSVFHVLSWNSQKSRRPVKPVSFAEGLVVEEAITERKFGLEPFNKYSEFLSTSV